MGAVQQALLMVGGGAAELAWSVANRNTSWALSGSNRVATYSGSAIAEVEGDRAHTSGKWYFEVLIGGTPDLGLPHSPGIGVIAQGTGNPSWNTLGGANATAWSYLRSALKRNNGSATAFGASYGAGDVIQVWLDFAVGIWWGKNDTVQGGGDPEAGTGAAYTSVSGTLVPHMAANTGTPVGTIRAAASSCAYSPRTGFSYW